MPSTTVTDTASDDGEASLSLSLGDIFAALSKHLRLLTLGPLAVGVAALGVSFLIPPTYTAKTTFLPPQQQQSGAASALASLGALASIAGASAGIKSPAEQYVALMQSTTVEDRLVDRFKLMQVYDVKFRSDARKELEKNVRIAVGKKDGLISVEADDESPQRAADLANAHIEELRRMASGLALSEAQQRRVFFESQLQQVRAQLTEAQLALQGSGFNASALKAEPKAAAEGYATLRAQATAAEVRLQVLRQQLADGAPEIQQQQAVLSALRSKLAQSELGSSDRSQGPDYISRYREYKYQETLFDLYARQFELARADEAREGALIQVIDPAAPPERKSRPKRGLIAIFATLASLLLLGNIVLILELKRRAADKQLELTT